MEPGENKVCEVGVDSVPIVEAVSFVRVIGSSRSRLSAVRGKNGDT